MKDLLTNNAKYVAVENHDIFEIERQKILERIKTAEGKLALQSKGIKDKLAPSGVSLEAPIGFTPASSGLGNILNNVAPLLPFLIAKSKGKSGKKSFWKYILVIASASVVAEVITADKFELKSVVKRILKWI